VASVFRPCPVTDSNQFPTPTIAEDLLLGEEG